MILKRYYLTYSKSTTVKPGLYGKNKLCTFEICLVLQSKVDTQAKTVTRLERCLQDSKTRLTSYARTRKRVSRRGRVRVCLSNPEGHLMTFQSSSRELTLPEELLTSPMPGACLQGLNKQPQK